MAARQSRTDWSFGPGHGPISGVLNASGSAMGLTMVAYLFQVWWIWGLTIGLITAGAAAYAARRQHAPEEAIAYRVLCWTGAGMWSAWALAQPPEGSFSGPWDPLAWILLLAGAIPAAIIGSVFKATEDREEAKRAAEVEALNAKIAAEEAARLEEAPEHDRIAQAWQAEIRRQTKRNVTIIGVEFWEPNTGFTLDIELPADGTTIDDLKGFEKTLAGAMTVPLGCAVEVVDPNVGRRVVHMKVGTHDAMKDDHPLPDGCEPTTIENDIPIGIQADRKVAALNIRYTCTVLIGQTNSGKSNELNVITHGLARCTDSIIWALDKTGGGRYPRPWVRAWAQGRAKRPAIDWVANSDLEMVLMCAAAQELITYRTADYEQVMFENGWDKIMVSPEVPELVLVVDEYATLPPRVQEMLRQISDTGRGAAVRVVSCALEATATYIPRGMIAQSRNRVSMRVQDEAQIQYLYDATWKSGRFDMTTMRIGGAGLFSADASPPERFKGYWLDPKRLDADSIIVGEWRPALDDLSAMRADTVTIEVAGKHGEVVQKQFTGVYTNRWERTLPVMFPNGQARQAIPAPAQAQGGVAVAERPEEPAQDVIPPPAKGGVESMGQAMADLADVQRRLAAYQAADSPKEPAGDEPQPAGGSGPTDEPDWSVVQSWLNPEAPVNDESGKPKPLPRVRMHQLVWDARNTGIGPKAVFETLQAEGYTTVYQTVRDWMGDDAQAGILKQPGGPRTPYYPGAGMTTRPGEETEG